MAMFRNVNVAPIDTSGFERAGAAYGQMFQNLGNTVAQTIQKYEKKKAIRGYVEAAPPNIQAAMGITNIDDPKQVKIAADAIGKAPQEIWNLIQLSQAASRETKEAAVAAALARQDQENWQKQQDLRETAMGMQEERFDYEKERQPFREKVEEAEYDWGVAGEKRDVDAALHKKAMRPFEVTAAEHTEAMHPHEVTAIERKNALLKQQIDKQDKEVEALLTTDELATLRTRLKSNFPDDKIGFNLERVGDKWQVNSFTINDKPLPPVSTRQVDDLREAEEALESAGYIYVEDPNARGDFVWVWDLETMGFQPDHSHRMLLKRVEELQNVVDNNIGIHQLLRGIQTE